MKLDDTIAAVATASGESGISVVRVSGPDALSVADRVFRGRGAPPSQRGGRAFLLGHALHDGQMIDQVILLLMPKPHSYTGEDVVELQGHGGRQCAQRILRAVLEAGARLADPGEFTQRAFLNGRMDLVQAEAVADLIHARSERAATAALAQLEGRLSHQINQLYDRLIATAADIEATLDFPEDELPETVMPELIRRTSDALIELDQLIGSWDEGHLLRDGALVVILGPPNAGKSTLLNALLGRERAIVSSSPGTTRDTIEEDLVIAGVPIRLIDTAGLRETDCEIEQIGITRTRAKQEQADVLILMLDSSQPPDESIQRLLSSLPADRSLIVCNKTDLGQQWDAQALTPYTVIETSLKTDVQAHAVRQAIRDSLTERFRLDARPHATISERHRQLLQQARREVEQTLQLLQAGEEELVPLASAQIRDALDAIGEVTGRRYHEELLDQIFARFCIGK